MSHLNECLNKYTAVYRCPDDVNCLKIKIKIKEILGNGDSDRWEEKIFEWQKKSFSKFEKELYKDPKNCLTDLEKKYHSDISNEAETAFDLYCHTNEEDFNLKEESSVNYLQKQMKQLQVTSEEGSDNDEFDLKASIMASVGSSVIYNDFEVMYLMADLGEYVGTAWVKYEKVLCALKYDKTKKVLFAYPDFTKTDGYRFQINGNSARNFVYYIENVSDAISKDDFMKEDELITKLSNHKLAMRKQMVDVKFELPAKNQLRVHLFLEILWAKQFEYDTIFIQYFIDLPPYWRCEDQSNLRGMTQTCHTKDQDGIAHFGHVYDVVLDYNIEELHREGIPRCPYIYFEVISKDTWDRFRTEGLTFKNLPVAQPGNYRYELPCFQLVPDSISGKLRRFFIGDCSNYDDITWVGIPRNHEGSILNKYGTTTLGTGQLGVRINVLHHSQVFLEKFDKSKEIFEKLSCSRLVKSVEQVLTAFRKARKNMIEARKDV